MAALPHAACSPGNACQAEAAHMPCMLGLAVLLATAHAA